MSQKQMSSPPSLKNQLEEQLGQRSQYQVASRLHLSGRQEKGHVPVFLSGCDEGVARNGGRRGSRFAPECLINQLKKLALAQQSLQTQCDLIATFTHRPDGLDSANFEARQLAIAQEMAGRLSEQPCKLLHVGGGHDWIVPMLLMLQQHYGAPITVVNLDAHLDTRTDAHPHSGTPFRQFARLSKHPFHLIQVGIHDYANAASNFEPLPGGHSMQQMAPDKLSSLSIPANHLIVLSLDADGLDGALMPGVSAVNPDGLNKDQLRLVMNWFMRQPNSTRAFGIYEYNPLYEGLASPGARYLASLMFRFLFE